MVETAEHPELKLPPGRNPATSTFIILLVVLWALNLADIFQTLYFKEAELLAMEANYFIDFFLKEGRGPFIWAKLLALILITSFLCRGWFDKRGCVVLGHSYEPPLLKRAIMLLLTAGTIYYIIIVGFPFFAMLISGFLTPPIEQAVL